MEEKKKFTHLRDRNGIPILVGDVLVDGIIKSRHTSRLTTEELIEKTRIHATDDDESVVVQTVLEARLNSAQLLLEACKEVLIRLTKMSKPIASLDKGRYYSSISILGIAIAKAESREGSGEVSDYQRNCGYTDEG